MALLSTRHDAASGSDTELCWELSVDEGNQDFRWSGSLGGSAAPPPHCPHVLTHMHMHSPRLKKTHSTWGLQPPGRRGPLRKGRATQEGPTEVSFPHACLSPSLVISGYFPAENLSQIGDCSYCKF